MCPDVFDTLTVKLQNVPARNLKNSGELLTKVNVVDENS